VSDILTPLRGRSWIGVFLHLRTGVPDQVIQDADKMQSHGIIDAMDNGSLVDGFHAQRRQAAWIRCDWLIAVFQFTPP
jgi:hypothetical protein